MTPYARTHDRSARTRASRTRTLAVAGAVVAALALSSCSGGSGGSGDGGRLTLKAVDYFVDDPTHGQWDAVLKQCGRKVGVDVDHQSIPGDQLVPKVLQYASSHTMPDLLMLNNPDVQEIASTGALTKLSDYDVDTSGFYDTILSAGTYQKDVYALTPTVNAVALFYNKDMFAKAGIDGPPRTWAELDAMAPKLKRGKVYPISFSAANSFEGSAQFLQAFWSNGGNLNRLDSPQGVQALTYWSDLVKDGYASRGVLSFTQGDAADAFAAGKAAMTVNGPWNIPLFDKTKGLNWAVAPLPTRTTDQDVVPSLGGESWTVPATDTDHQRAAAKVLGCITGPDQLLGLAGKTYNVPSRVAVAKKYATQVPKMRSFVAEVRTARPRTLEVGRRYPKVGAALADAIQAAATGAKTPQQAMRDAQRASGNG